MKPAIRLVAFACAFFLGACSTIGDMWAPAQPACEPATGQTYTVRIRDQMGGVERAAAPDARCVAPAPGALKITAKVLCLAADGQSLAVAWDDARNVGAVYVSSTKLPGCAK